METSSNRSVPLQIGDAEASVAAEVLKALGHPIRLRILYLLTANEEHVKGIAQQLSVAPAIVSQQLRILRSAGLVSATTRGGHAYYRIVEQHLCRMLNCIESCVTARVARGET